MNRGGEVDFWDFDGTVADTAADIAASYRAALAAHGVPTAGFEEKFRIGPPLEVTLRMMLPGADDALVAAVAATFRARYDASGFPATRLYPGMLAALDRRRGRGVRLVILTNKRRIPTVALLEKLGADDRFAAVHTSDDPGGPWTKGRLLCDLLRRNRLDPAACRMIGDTAGDVAAAREAGIRAVGVTWGYGAADELADADTVVDSPAEL